MHVRIPASTALLLAGILFTAAPQEALAQSGSMATPFDRSSSDLNTASATFRIDGRAKMARAPALALKVVNYFGLQNETLRGLKAQEGRIREILKETGLPGVLVYVRDQTSMTEVPVTTLVGGAPLVVAAGLDPMSTWVAYETDRHGSLVNKVQDGFRSDASSSYFLWATEKDGAIEYGLHENPLPILNEARRRMSDEKLRKQFEDTYDDRLRQTIVADIERTSGERKLKERARNLIASRDAALEEKRQIEKDLSQALERAARAQAVSATFSTLSNILTVAQLGMSLAAEFPEVSDAAAKATSTSDLQGLLEGVMKDAQQSGVEASGRARSFEDRMIGIRKEEIVIFTEGKIQPSKIRGLQGLSKP